MICYVIPVADAQNSYDFIKSDESILLGIFLILVLLLVLYIIRTNRKQNEELIRTAELDGLTGAYNKRATEAYINKILTQMPDEKGTFVILDVDKFKEVNDQYGHAVGDTVLHELSKTFFRHFREDDIIGRISTVVPKISENVHGGSGSGSGINIVDIQGMADMMTGKE